MRLNEILLEFSIPHAVADAAEREMLLGGVAGDSGFSEEHYSMFHGDDYDESEYKEWEREQVEGAVMDAIGRLEYDSEVRDGRIMIYREITVPKTWTIDQLSARSLGEYWSWDKEAAEAHWGGNDGMAILLVSSVSPEDVEWVVTVAKNAHPSGEEEKEIEVKSGTRLPILGVYRGTWPA